MRFQVRQAARGRWSRLTSEFLGWIVEVPGLRLHDTAVIDQPAKQTKTNATSSQVQGNKTLSTMQKSSGQAVPGPSLDLPTPPHGGGGSHWSFSLLRCPNLTPTSRVSCCPLRFPSPNHLQDGSEPAAITPRVGGTATRGRRGPALCRLAGPRM